MVAWYGTWDERAFLHLHCAGEEVTFTEDSMTLDEATFDDEHGAIIAVAAGYADAA